MGALTPVSSGGHRPALGQVCGRLGVSIHLLLSPLFIMPSPPGVRVSAPGAAAPRVELWLTSSQYWNGGRERDLHVGKVLCWLPDLRVLT